MYATPSVWRDKDLLSSNTENPDTHISGFPARANLHFKPFNQALCMASQPPQNFPSKISGQGTQSYLWWYASPWGNFIKLPRFPRRRTRWVATAQLEGQILSFRTRRRHRAFDPQKKAAAAKASPDTSPTNRASTRSPPIRLLSPAPALSNLKLPLSPLAHLSPL